MERLNGQPGSPRLRQVSPLAGLAIMLVLVVVVALIIMFAVVAIPVLIVTGLAVGGYRVLKAKAVRKTNELLNRDEAGRHNVRVLRSPSTEQSSHIP